MTVAIKPLPHICYPGLIAYSSNIWYLCVGSTAGAQDTINIHEKEAGIVHQICRLVWVSHLILQHLQHADHLADELAHCSITANATTLK